MIFIDIFVKPGEKIESVEVRWPSGKVQVPGRLKTGMLYRITEMQKVEPVGRQAARWKQGTSTSCH